MGWELGEDRKASWCDRLLLVSSAQAAIDWRRRNADHRESGVGQEVSPMAAACHELARHAQAWLSDSYLRVLSNPRLQLPHDRHPGGSWARADQAPARNRRAAAFHGSAIWRVVC